MSIFDKLKSGVANVANAAAQSPSAGAAKQTFTFAALPESLAQMQALPEAALQDPFQTAALTVCALCVYAADKNIGAEMLNWLRGPRPLSPMDISFLNDRFREGHHVPFSYFAGATPENDYTPTQPFTLTIEAGPYADANPGYKKLHIRSGGADYFKLSKEVEIQKQLVELYENAGNVKKANRIYQDATRRLELAEGEDE